MFLIIILVHFGVVAFLIFWGSFLPDSIMLNFLMSQGIIIIPTIIFLLIFERREQMPAAPTPQMQMPGMPTAPVSQRQMPGVPPMFRAPRQFEAAAFHKVKISTLLMIALCTFLMMPLVTVLNALTMFFTENAVAAMEGDIVSTSFPAMLFMIGIFGPFCEEFVFRGVIYRSYRRGGCDKNYERYQNARNNGVSAMLLSALLFGLMHMNFNQAVYAFVLGIFLVLLVEAAGSLWASVFCHMFFNSCQVVLMYASESILNSVYGQTVNASEQISTQELLAVLSVYLVIAAVTTPIAGCVIVWIAKNEGRQETFRALFRRQGGRTVPQPPYQRPQWSVPPSQQAPQPQPTMQMNQPQQPFQQAQPVQQSTMQMNQPQQPFQQPPQVPQQHVPPQLIPAQPLPPEPPRAEYLLSVPLVIAIVLCLGYMSLELILLG